MRITKIIYTLIFSIAFASCASTQEFNNYRNFIEYSNENKIAMKADSEVTKDKYFKIKIPKATKTKIQSTSDVFMQILEFEKNEKIVIIYDPFSKDISQKENLNLSNSDFEKLCEKENLLERLNKYTTFKKSRRFGLKKISGVGFYVMYLNIYPKDVSNFNYAIRSIQL